MPAKNESIEPNTTIAANEEEVVQQDSGKLLEALLGAPDEVTKQVEMKRFGGFFTVRSITSEEYAKLENRCKFPVKNKRTNTITEKVDQEKLSRLLIVTACTAPNWSDPKLLAKYGTDDPCVVINKRLLIGEITAITQAIMDVSGFSDEIEEVKN